MSLNVFPAFTLTDHRFELRDATDRAEVIRALRERAGMSPPPRRPGPLRRLRERIVRARERRRHAASLPIRFW